ncbi:MAG: hypothetical protein IKX98_06560 [Clostridia bacterium]|nr:hypothetical protein [Clostridia bacterium]
MNFDTMHKAIIMIDSDLIEAADAQPEIAKPTAFKPWMKYAVAAVLIAVFAIGTPVALNMAGVFGANNTVDPASSGSGSGSDVSEVIYPPEDDSHSTVSEPPQPITPASPGSYEEPDPNEAHGGDRERWSDSKYLAYDDSLDKLTSISKNWADYILEQTGAESLDALWKSVWGGVEHGNVAPYSLIEIVEELNIPREKFVELNNGVARYNYFTEEEIDIIYSGDKKRIAEAFASPWAVVAEDWEIYPIRWLLNNSASTYKEKHIPVDALETVVDRYLNDKRLCCLNDDEISTLLANVEEYKNMQ